MRFVDANERPVAVEDLDVDILKTIALEAVGFMRVELWSEGCLGFEPRFVMSKGRLWAKMRHSGEATMPGKGVGRAVSLRVVPWHLP